MKFDENMLESVAQEILEDLGFIALNNTELMDAGMRKTFRECILWNNVREAIERINPKLSSESIDDAIIKLRNVPSGSLIEKNHYYHTLFVQGVDVDTQVGNEIRTLKAWLIDFDNLENNDFLSVQQFTVVENENRRPDIVLFLNGFPITVIELKSMINEDVGIIDAFQQIQTYKREIPSLFETNLMNVISDGTTAKVGSLSADFERYMFWREDIEGGLLTQMEELFRGTLDRRVILKLMQNFVLFKNVGDIEIVTDGQKEYTKKMIKILAAYHQYHAVLEAVDKTKLATAIDGNRKIGVVWHTQGSGKSLTMVFYAASLLTMLKNPTIVLLTDRNDLDDQLFTTFSTATELLHQTPKQAESREHLKELLRVRSGGIIFTTIQKFSDNPDKIDVLTDRTNVVVIVDEAHRSQYGFAANIDSKTGAVKYGNAQYMRQALPNASFIGFTGTPIETQDKSTPAVFGDYIDVYDMSQSVEDGSTVKLYYEPRIVKLTVNEDVLDELDEAFDTFASIDASEGGASKAKLSAYERVVGAPERLARVSSDIVEHYTNKSKTLPGKAMIVVMSREIAVDLYNQIIAIIPEWHNNNVDKGVLKVVMSGSASDSEKLSIHTGGKNRRERLSERMRDFDDELKLVIVCDMWLTGFDVPSMHTMYIDKPMKGHNLMQAIARVNRVFKDKPGGALVDYIGILSSLEEALNEYTDRDKRTVGINIYEVVCLMQEKLEVIDGMLHGFDYQIYFNKSERDMLNGIRSGMNFVIGLGEEEEKEFKIAVQELSQTHALCASTDEGKRNAYKVGYFKAIRANLIKIKNTILQQNRFDANNQMMKLVDQSIIAEKIIDINDLVGANDGEISILSEEFLESIKQLEHKNVAVEVLKNILLGKIKSVEQINLSKAEKFSEKLQKAINQYHNQAITNTEMLEFLLSFAKEMNKADDREKEFGLTPEEMSFYDALSFIPSVEKAMEVDVLVKIAREITKTIQKNKTIDWSSRKTALPRMRSEVRRLLKKYKYPPENEDAAIGYVMSQVKLTADRITVSVVYDDDYGKYYKTLD